MSEELQSSYDRVAEDYAERFRDELDKKPFDRKMPDWLAEKVGRLGVICDMGCGGFALREDCFTLCAQACRRILLQLQ